MPLVDYDSDSSSDFGSDSQCDSQCDFQCNYPDSRSDSKPDCNSDSRLDSQLDFQQRLPQILRETDLHGCLHTFIYLEYSPSRQVADLLHNCIESKPGRCSLVYSELGALQALHISLSSTLMIPKSECERFFAALQAAISKISIRPLTFSGKLISLPNPSRTRWFSGLLFAEPHVADLQSAMTAINKVLTGLRLGQPLVPTDYPHISIAHTAEQMKDETLDLSAVPPLAFSALNVRCGSRVYTLSLGQSRSNRPDVH